MFYTCNYNIRVTHRNGAIKHILHESDPRRIISRLFFIHFVAPCMFFICLVKILLQIFLYEDLSTLALHTSVSGLYFPPECQRTHFVITILLSENIPNIWHKSSTKHRRSDQDWNDKSNQCKLRALVSHGRFYQWLELPFLKKYSIKCEKI